MNFTTQAAYVQLSFSLFFFSWINWELFDHVDTFYAVLWFWPYLQIQSSFKISNRIQINKLTLCCPCFLFIRLRILSISQNKVLWLRRGLFWSSVKWQKIGRDAHMQKKKRTLCLLQGWFTKSVRKQMNSIALFTLSLKLLGQKICKKWPKKGCSALEGYRNT